MKKYEENFQKYFQDFLTYLDISEKEFWKVAIMRSKHLWKKSKINGNLLQILND